MMRLRAKVPSSVPSSKPLASDNRVSKLVKSHLAKLTTAKPSLLHHTITNKRAGEVHVASYCAGSEIQEIAGREIVRIGGSTNSKYITDYTVEKSAVCQSWISALGAVLEESPRCNFKKMETAMNFEAECSTCKKIHDIPSRGSSKVIRIVRFSCVDISKPSSLFDGSFMKFFLGEGQSGITFAAGRLASSWRWCCYS